MLSLGDFILKVSKVDYNLICLNAHDLFLFTHKPKSFQLAM